jgi:hypothetical protein
MLRLATMRGRRGDSIPASLTTLSVSWLNNQFKAVAIHRGAVEGTWERAGELEGAASCEALIREAVARTNYHGQTVSLLLAHPRLVQQLVDVPPVKGPAMHRILQRQAQQQKLFPGEAAWTCQTSFSGKGAQRVILHLFPKLLLDQLVQGCQRNGLDLISVVPVSAVLHNQLALLPLDEDEGALLAADVGGSTSVVVGRKDGQLQLVRTLPNTWNESVDRLALDLNRTILFLTQQYGAAVNEGVWLFGPGAREQASALQGQMQLSVAVSPVDYQPAYWATEALKLRLDRTPNFLSPQLQKAPQRRAYAKVVGVGALLLVLAAMGAFYFSLRQARQDTAAIAGLRQRVTHLEARRQELQRRNAEFSRQQQLINFVLEGQPPPVPVWFLGYLSEVVPPGLAVTNLHFKLEEDGWKLQLTAAGQGGSNPPAPSDGSNAVARLRTQLAEGSFHFTPLSGSQKEPATRSSAGPKPGEHLVIEGVIR